jgi:alginate O-acetyltransferase complex protein AlgI
MLDPGAMLFNSFEYLLLFLPLTVVVYFFLNRRAGAMAGKLWLVLASLFFYGWWSVSYLWLICGSMLFNYGMARWLGHTDGGKARIILAAAIAGNLALLGYYKYADFFISNINLLNNNPIPLLHLALPLGISFFTFTQIAFLVDVHRKVAHEYSLVHYFLFVTYFPHLIAGPILHHKEMMPQFASPATRTVDWRNIHLGLFILSIGLMKKVILADPLAFAANEGFNSAEPLVFHNAWVTSLSYTLQLYFDFSGYCDMAIGASLIFNIRLPENFNSPYKALNIQDFWRRWHITLSRWLRDYLYIPLGGNRYGLSRSYAALLVTFLLGGLWHGPSWTFVTWGLLHGTAAVLHRGWTLFHFRMPAFWGWLLTFLFVNAAWVFFRADSIPVAIGILKGMIGINGFPAIDEIALLLRGMSDPGIWSPNNETVHFPARKLMMLAAGLALVWLLPNTAQLAKKEVLSEPSLRAGCIAGSAIGISIFYTLFIASSSGMASFIYFYF